MNVQKKYANWSLDRRLASGVLAEMVKIFKGLYCPINNQQFCTQRFQQTG